MLLKSGGASGIRSGLVLDLICSSQSSVCHQESQNCDHQREAFWLGNRVGHTSGARTACSFAVVLFPNREVVRIDAAGAIAVLVNVILRYVSEVVAPHGVVKRVDTTVV